MCNYGCHFPEYTDFKCLLLLCGYLYTYLKQISAMLQILTAMKSVVNMANECHTTQIIVIIGGVHPTVV